MNTVFSKNKTISIMMKKCRDDIVYLKQFLRYFNGITAYILSIRWRSGRMCTHLLWWELQNYNSLLNNHQQDPTKKRSPHPKSKKPQQDGRRDEIAFRIKSHAHQRCSKGQTKPCAHHEAPQRLSQTCLWVFECLLQRDTGSAVTCLGIGTLAT